MRIDAHQHFWKLSRGDYDWITPDLDVLNRDYLPDDLKPLLDAAGVDGTVLVQATDRVEETRFMLGLADRHDWILGVVGWVDMEADNALATLSELSAHPKFVGIRPMIQGIEDTGWMLRPALQPVYETLVERELCFDALVLPRHLKNLHTLMVRYPDLPCVIDHAAKPEIRNRAFDGWAEDMARLAGETSCLCKLSGLVTEAEADWTVEGLRPYVDHLLRCFGPERIMFGSDWPVLNLAGDYEKWHAAALSLTGTLAPRDRDAVFGANAASFYLSGKNRAG